MTLKKLTLAQIEVGSQILSRSEDASPAEIVAVYNADTQTLIRAKTDPTALDTLKAQAYDMDPDESADIVSFFIESVANFTQRCLPKTLKDQAKPKK